MQLRFWCNFGYTLVKFFANCKKMSTEFNKNINANFMAFLSKFIESLRKFIYSFFPPKIKKMLSKRIGNVFRDQSWGNFHRHVEIKLFPFYKNISTKSEKYLTRIFLDFKINFKGKTTNLSTFLSLVKIKF